MAYRGKYPNRVNGYSSTYIKGVYSITTRSGARFYVAGVDMRAAGYTVSMDQLMGQELPGFACASLEAAAQRQQAK